MECFVCARSMSELKRLIDVDNEAKQIFLLISDVSHIKKSDYLCKVCLSLLQAAAAFKEVCAMSDLCFSRRKQVVALDDTQIEFVTHSDEPQKTDFIKIEPNQEQEDSKSEDHQKQEDDDDSDFNYPGGDDDWNMDEHNTQPEKINTEKLEASYTCDICGKSVKMLRSLHRHLIKVHKQPDPNESTTAVIENTDERENMKIQQIKIDSERNRGRENMSSVWLYFKKPDPIEKKAECKVCKFRMRCTGGSTSSMRKHLQARHKINLDGMIKIPSESNIKIEKNLSKDQPEHFSIETINVGVGSENYGRVKMSSVWVYFKKPDPVEKKAKCKLCTKQMRCVGGSTSGLRSHLHAKHKIKLGTLADTSLKKTKPKTEKKKRQKSIVWSYFTKCDSLGEIVVCNLCNKQITRSQSSTSAMKSHLLHRHKLDIKNQNNSDEPQKTDFIKIEPNQEQEDSKSEDHQKQEDDDDSDFNYPGGDDDWNMDEHSTQPGKINTEKLEASYTCDICGKSVKMLRSLHQHLIKVHKQPDPNESTSAVIGNMETKSIIENKRRPSSAVWNYFTKSDMLGETVVCNLCNKQISRSQSSTSAMKSHLFHRHRLDINSKNSV